MYFLDLQFGVELPMPSLPLDPHFVLEMEDDDLVVPHLTHRLGQDFGPLHMGLPHHDIVGISHKKNLVQLDFASRLNRQALYFDDLARGNPVLLSSGLNYSVNGFPPSRDAD
jgi:hypothetical protein